MAYVIGELQQEVLEKVLAREIKKHLRKFAKTTDMERNHFEEFLEDWENSVDGTELMRLYQSYRQIEGNKKLLEIEF